MSPITPLVHVVSLQVLSALLYGDENKRVKSRLHISSCLPFCLNMVGMRVILVQLPEGLSAHTDPHMSERFTPNTPCGENYIN